MLLGRFLGGTWRSNGRVVGPAMMTGWSFCPVDENGDKLDAAPVLRGEDARRLAEQRRRVEARRHLAELGQSMSEFQKTTQAIKDGLSRIRWFSGSDFGRVEVPREPAKPLTEADRCPQCDEYLMPCPRCPPSSLRTVMDTKELADVKAELAYTKQKLVEVTNKLIEVNLSRVRDLKVAIEGLAKYAPVGPASLESKENDCKQGAELQQAIQRLSSDWKTVDHAARILSTLPPHSPDRRVLVVLRGLPGSGKSTAAQAIVDSDPGRWARVSKDDVRQMMVGPSGDLFRFVEDRAREMVVAKTAEEMTMSALRLGLDVVVDATNLTNRALGAWRMAAMVVNRDGRGPVLVCERAVPTPVEECVARDARRGARSVGRAVIERLAATIDVPLEDRNQEVEQ